MFGDVRFWRGLALGLSAVVLILAMLAARALLLPITPTPPDATVTEVPRSPEASPLLPSAPPHEPAPAPAGTPPPTASPAGGTLALALRQNGHSQLYALSIAGGPLQRLMNCDCDDRDPAWSPDAQRLAFASHRDGNWELYILDLATGSAQRVTNDPAFDGQPAWSPDGQWLAYETNRTGNLDIFVTSLDGSQVYQVTGDPFADYSPSWSPDGRRIAYISWRVGNPDVWMTDLSRAGDDQAVNLTVSQGMQESGPRWSPEGAALAYADASSGQPIVYTLPVNADGQPGTPLAVGQGSTPAWGPPGQGLAVAYGALSQGPVALITVGLGGTRALAPGTSLPALPTGASWTAATLPVPEPAWLRAVNAAPQTPAYVEHVAPRAVAGPPYALVPVGEGRAQAFSLSDRVDDGFSAWRARVLAESGYDYLAAVDAAWLAPGEALRADDSPRSWHAAGRAVDLAEQGIAPLAVIRETAGLDTYWQVWLPARLQDGTQGEPLRNVPWEFAARYRGGRARADGGAYAQGYPTGATYYVDITLLAADYGWRRVPAGDDWRTNWAGIRAWHFERTDALAWRDALLEVLPPEAVDALAGSR